MDKSIEKQNSISNKIVIVILFLMALGAVFVFSASANVKSQFELKDFYKYTAIRQLIFFPAAIIIMLVFSAINYRFYSFKRGFLKSPLIYILAICVPLLALLLIQRYFHVIPENLIPRINSHYRWFKIPAGPMEISFQPSELAKWTVIFFVAAACAKLGQNLNKFLKAFIPTCFAVGIIVALIIIEDLGTAAFICLLTFLLLLLAGAKYRYLLAPATIAIAGIILILFLFPHRMRRITNFIHAGDLSIEENYQINQSLIAIASGELTGKGLGRGISKYGHLPEDTTDFIFAVIGEELGFVGTTSVISLFAIFTWLGLLVIKRCDDPFGKLLAAGIVLAISIQAAINIGVVTVVLPTKGIPLPFVSSGGTSMLLSSAAIGVLLNISKQTEQKHLLTEEYQTDFSIDQTLTGAANA